MILVTHAVGGGVAALLFPQNPLLAFTAGFASHFVLDAVPHWHYPVRSVRHSKNPMDSYWVFDTTFLKDLFFIGLDAASGIGLTLLATHTAPPDKQLAIVFGAIGGIMPDALQLLYSIFRNSPFKYLQRFHIFIHHSARLDDQYLIGIGSQLAILLVLFLVLQHSMSL